MASDWNSLAREVRNRRNELGRSQGDLGSYGGPSRETVRMIEIGERSNYRSQTFTQLDLALQWRSGTAEAIVEGTAGDDPELWKAATHEASASGTALFSARSSLMAGTGVLGPSPQTISPASRESTTEVGRPQVHLHHYPRPFVRRRVEPDGSVWEFPRALSADSERIGYLPGEYKPLVDALFALENMDLEDRQDRITMSGLLDDLQQARDALTIAVTSVALTVKPDESGEDDQ